MKQMSIINKLMNSIKTSPKPFINHNNELILIPKFNVYFLLDDVNCETDVMAKMCEWFSRDCCYALRYVRRKMLDEYYQNNTDTFNKICGTDFTIKEMELIYTYLGNACNHKKTLKFINSGFDLNVLTGNIHDKEDNNENNENNNN